MFLLVECRAELSKATSTIASLCEQLDGAKSQSASTSAQLTQVQVWWFISFAFAYVLYHAK